MDFGLTILFTYISFFTVLNDTTGGVITLGSPSVKYEEDLSCGWEVETPIGTTINITFERFNIEYYDYLEIYDLVEETYLMS